MLSMLFTRLKFAGRNEAYIDRLEDYELKIIESLHSYKDYDFHVRDVGKVNRTLLHALYRIKSSYVIFENKIADLMKAYNESLEKLGKSQYDRTILAEYEDQIKRILKNKKEADVIAKRLSALKQYIEGLHNEQSRAFTGHCIMFVNRFEDDFSRSYKLMNNLERPDR